MRSLALVLLVLLAACASPAKPQPSPEQRRYRTTVRSRTPDACRRYLQDFPDGDHRDEIRALLQTLRDESFAGTLEQDSEPAYASHLKRFPEDEERVAEERASRRAAALEAIRRARTVKLVLAYQRNDRAASFPEPYPVLVRGVLESTGLRLEEEEPADLVVTVSAQVRIRGQQYSGLAYRANAHGEFTGSVEFRSGNAPPLRETFASTMSNAPHVIRVPVTTRGSTGGVTPQLLIARAKLFESTMGLIQETYGPAPLVRCLESGKTRLRWAARDVLKKRPSPEQVELLRPLLHRGDPDLLSATVSALAVQWKPGPEAEEHERLMFYLFGPSGQSLRGLTVASAPRAAELVQSKVSFPRLWQERAALLLAYLGEAGVDPLVRALEKSRGGEGVGWALARLGTPAAKRLVALLQTRDGALRNRVIEVLVRMRVPEVLEKKRNGRPRFIHLSYEEARRRVELTPVLAQLRHEEGRWRIQAAELLTGVYDRRVFEPLLAALEDENRRVREAVAKALGVYGDARAIPALEARLAVPEKHPGPFDRALRRLREYAP